MGNLINENQIIGIVCLVVGTAVLAWCSRMERADSKKRRDIKEKWSYIDGERDDEISKQKARGFVLTLIGAALSFFGLISFMINISFNE